MYRLKKLLLTVITLTVVTVGTMTTRAIAAPQPISGCQTINASGSYILTQNLTSPGDCLIVATGNVTIDLDGYTIAGPRRPPNERIGSGITWPGGEIKNIAIRNGMIAGFRYGVNFGLDSQRILVERMILTGNTFAGVKVGRESNVRDNIVSDCHIGMNVGPNSIVSGNASNGNEHLGISVRADSSVIGNVANNNGTNGIEGNAQTGISYINNVTSNNGSFGIRPGCPSNLLGNTAVNNGEFDLPTGPGCNMDHNLPPPPQ